VSPEPECQREGSVLALKQEHRRDVAVSHVGEAGSEQFLEEGQPVRASGWRSCDDQVPAKSVRVNRVSLGVRAVAQSAVRRIDTRLDQVDAYLVETHLVAFAGDHVSKWDLHRPPHTI
jgi:hypothetical protein